MANRGTAGEALQRGRRAFERGEWGAAFAQLSAADLQRRLQPDDLDLLATAAHLVGKDEEGAEAWTRAHHGFLGLGQIERAARSAFWLGFHLVDRGEMARGGGWLARAGRLLEEGQKECVEQGYLLLVSAIQTFQGGDAAAADAMFATVASIGDRFGDQTLITLARLGRGRAKIRTGKTVEGVALLDEVMIAVTAGEVSPVVVGDVYCTAIITCQEMFDLRRSHEWAQALSRWCAAHPDLVPYRGQCLVHRAEIMQLHGEWVDAASEAQRALDRLSDPPGQPAVGMAYYQLAELHRLRGAFAKAEDAYRQANQWGRVPQPGLAQMRLAQGQVGAAAASIRRALDEAQDHVTRSRFLLTHVDVMLAGRDVGAARAGADELKRIAETLDASVLRASGAYSNGAVLLAEGNPQAALWALRQAWGIWQELEAPYEAARVRVLIGVARRELGDEDGAELEFDAARRVFRELGAVPDLTRLDSLSVTVTPETAGGLTGRELEVLRLVASGKTNRAIADDLVLSEKTVARHVSNIFAKLGLSSRSAATAFAYEHDLV
jgi:DNA-binding CsgD family transcriptional regulator